ncbi:hypothetical protein [Clostridium aciditolerans]|uniref:Uncharacterized protein n=1 Tax=Clostridium aciditolerans TaxID=339861 RepID=A0A934HZK9_9CLOT|nr:hypothetical protein [Clostridium aciditolerans]MBI6873295.1 hypothetical protein [Clostridium aciditolerans]
MGFKIIADYHTHTNIAKGHIPLINTIKKYEITILNHPLEHVNPDIIEIGKIADLRNTALEINRSHRNMDIETIKKLKNMGVKFSLGSDAHKSEDVEDFGNAYNTIIKIKQKNKKLGDLNDIHKGVL